jgi:hypothetical protein
MPSSQEFEFHETVAKVEERFRPELTDEARARLGAMPGSGGGEEGKYQPEMVSTGWWVVLARFGIAVRFGSMKPDIVAGDTLVLIARRIPKPPEAPAPAPPPMPAPDLRGTLQQLRAAAPAEVAAKIDEAIAVLGPEAVT